RRGATEGEVRGEGAFEGAGHRRLDEGHGAIRRRGSRDEAALGNETNLVELDVVADTLEGVRKGIGGEREVELPLARRRRRLDGRDLGEEVVRDGHDVVAGQPGLAVDVADDEEAGRT